MSFSITDAKKIDLVQLLELLGHAPKKISGNDYWYLSPLREEKTASFKVNRSKNVWYDHGSGEGGSVIDFGIRYFNCTVKELLQKLPGNISSNFSFHPPRAIPAGEKKTGSSTAKIKILSTSAINDTRLVNYLSERRIPLKVAERFCKQVHFEINSRPQVAIGFENTGGGFELRNAIFKGSSTPKQPKLITEPASDGLTVFEGFFSFLSFQTLIGSGGKNWLDLNKIPTDFLILNSLAFLEKQRAQMEKYSSIKLFLDRDLAGKKATEKVLGWSPKFSDQSIRYQKFKDLNDYLVKSEGLLNKQKPARGRRL